MLRKYTEKETVNRRVNPDVTDGQFSFLILEILFVILNYFYSKYLTLKIILGIMHAYSNKIKIKNEEYRKGSTLKTGASYICLKKRVCNI